MAVDISEVARRTGFPASTLRFYEEKGLVATIGRRGARRLYDASVLERLALISLGRAAGFTLDEIAGMVGADGRPGLDRPNLDRRALAARADTIDLQIRRLKAVRDGLRHAAECPAPSHAECPTFQRLVRLAGEGRLDAPVAGSRRR